MNNIEILEDFIRYYETEYFKGKKLNSSIKIIVDEDDIEAIENLIQRNKELEQIEKEHKEENGILRDRIKELEEENAVQLKQLNSAFDRGYIPKSKVKEKIEESKRDYKEILDSMDRKISHTKDAHKIRGYYAEFGVKRGRLEAYQELLGDDN